jgi:hypothetical protein
MELKNKKNKFIQKKKWKKKFGKKSILHSELSCVPKDLSEEK